VYIKMSFNVEHSPMVHFEWHCNACIGIYIQKLTKLKTESAKYVD
jgi:hypothetical protein